MAAFFTRRGKQERAAFQLYTAAVAAARDPYLYTHLGVPDTLDGRFDAICIYVYLLIRHVGPQDAALAQSVFDAMFHDMDVNLREMGVGDLSVGKRNRKMWEAFHGRSAAYAAAWDDPSGLAAALSRNVWRGGNVATEACTTLARIARTQAVCLAQQPIETIRDGDVRFLPAEEAANAPA